ncbi:hypothetical protein C8Q79DRAFT_179085 [Trametes meyenii]|nr:hypothetical protein C8Q79DRAFT_179085 [Trametes meyenii]
MPLDEGDVLRADLLQGPYYGLPPVDRDSLSSVVQSASTDEFFNLLAERKHRLEQELLAINALHNAYRAPINYKLPAEILVLIMRSVQALYEMSHPLLWLPILEVCRYWFVVGASTPQLWCTVWRGTNLAFLRTTLARSKEAPLVVRLRNFKTLSQTMSALTPYAHRIREFTFPQVVLSSNVSCLVKFLDRSMPALEKLHLHMPGLPVGDREDVIQLSLDRLPRLVELSVTGVRFQPFPRLRQLRLLHWSGPAPGSTLDTLTAILRECVLVEELHLINVYREDDSGILASDSSVSPIALPKLQRFRITSPEQRVIKRVLSSIIFPPTAHVRAIWSIKSRTPDEQLNPGFYAILPFDLSGLPLLSGLTKAQVQLYSHRRSLIASAATDLDLYSVEGGPGPSLAVQLDNSVRINAMALNGVDDVLDICRISPLQELRLQMEAPKTQHVDWTALFARLPMLRRLVVHALESPRDNVSHDRLLRSLNPKFVPGDARGDERLVCPALCAIQFVGFDGLPGTNLLENLRDMLAERKAFRGTEKALDNLSFALHCRGGKLREVGEFLLRSFEPLVTNVSCDEV